MTATSDGLIGSAPGPLLTSAGMGHRGHLGKTWATCSGRRYGDVGVRAQRESPAGITPTRLHACDSTKYASLLLRDDHVTLGLDTLGLADEPRGRNRIMHDLALEGVHGSQVSRLTGLLDRLNCLSCQGH